MFVEISRIGVSKTYDYNHILPLIQQNGLDRQQSDQTENRTVAMSDYFLCYKCVQIQHRQKPKLFQYGFFQILQINVIYCVQKLQSNQKIRSKTIKGCSTKKICNGFNMVKRIYTELDLRQKFGISLKMKEKTLFSQLLMNWERLHQVAVQQEKKFCYNK